MPSQAADWISPVITLIFSQPAIWRRCSSGQPPMSLLAGRTSKMRQTKVPKILKPRLQSLLVGGSEREFADLRDLLAGTNERQVYLDHAPLPADVLNQFGKGHYDLILCSHQSTDDAAFHLLRQVRQHNSRVPVIFLSDPISQGAIDAAIQAGACHYAAQARQPEPGTALAVPSAIEVDSAQHQQQKSEETLRKLWRSVEQSADTVIIMDRSGVMEYVNPAFEALTGYSRQEAVGQTLGILKSEQQAGELYEEMWNTVLSGKVFRGIVMDRKKNGETLVIEKALTPLRDGQGEITHFISTGRDITERRKLESELRQAQKMDAIGRLAGGVAHDFNNLLLVISAYAELMLDSLSVEHPLRRNVGEIMTASRRAADLPGNCWPLAASKCNRCKSSI